MSAIDPTCHCHYTGYSPSGFAVLSVGEVECPECEGAGYHWHESTQEEELCAECEGEGSVPCFDCYPYEASQGTGAVCGDCGLSDPVHTADCPNRPD